MEPSWDGKLQGREGRAHISWRRDESSCRDKNRLVHYRNQSTTKNRCQSPPVLQTSLIIIATFWLAQERPIFSPFCLIFRRWLRSQSITINRQHSCHREYVIHSSLHNAIKDYCKAGQVSDLDLSWQECAWSFSPWHVLPDSGYFWGFKYLMPKQKHSAPKMHCCHPQLNSVQETEHPSLALWINSLVATLRELCPLQLTSSTDFGWVRGVLFASALTKQMNFICSVSFSLVL